MRSGIRCQATYTPGPFHGHPWHIVPRLPRRRGTAAVPVQPAVPLAGHGHTRTDCRQSADHKQQERERKTRASEIHGSAVLPTATWRRRRINQNRADPRGAIGACSSRGIPGPGTSDRRPDRDRPGTAVVRIARAHRGRRAVQTARAPCPARRGPARCPGTEGSSRSRCLVARSCEVRFRQRDSSSISLVSRHLNACNSCHSGRVGVSHSSRARLRRRRVLSCSKATQGSRHTVSAAAPPHLERTKVKNATSPSAASSMSITRAGSKMPSVALAGSSGK